MKWIKLIILSLCFILISAIFVGSNKSGNNSYTLIDFTNDIKSKSYNFELKEVGKDFLPTERKRLVIGEEAIDIYIFKNDNYMEKEAKNIEPSGFGYNSGRKAMKVDWVAEPHFYKKGSIIVQYIGTNEKIISDLKEILGEQFAGM